MATLLSALNLKPVSSTIYASSYYCSRETGRVDSRGNKERCGGEVNSQTGRCEVCGARN